MTMNDLNCYCLRCKSALFYGGYTRGNCNANFRSVSDTLHFVFEDRLVANSHFIRNDYVYCRGCSTALGCVYSTPQTDAFYLHTNVHFLAIRQGLLERRYIAANSRVRDFLRDNYLIVIFRRSAGQNTPGPSTVSVPIDEGGPLVPASVSAANFGGESSRAAGNFSVPPQIGDYATDPTGRRYFEMPPANDGEVLISTTTASVAAAPIGRPWRDADATLAIEVPPADDTTPLVVEIDSSSEDEMDF